MTFFLQLKSIVIKHITMSAIVNKHLETLPGQRGVRPHDSTEYIPVLFFFM